MLADAAEVDSGVRAVRYIRDLTEELTPATNLYDAIRDLRGWGNLLAEAQDSFSGSRPARSNVGRLISSLLLAADEHSAPIAVAGTLDEEGSGRLVVIYPEVIVLAVGTALEDAGGSFSVRCWPLTAARELALQTRHSYFDGTDRRARTSGVSVEFVVSEEKIGLQSSSIYRSDSPLTSDDAIYSAFKALRDAR